MSRVENLCARGARRRLVLGVVCLVAAVVAGGLLIWFDAPRAWRLSLVVPLGIAANAFLEARERTCVVLAALGKREREEGGYARVSDEERTAARRQMWWIVARATVIAVVPTAIAWLI